MAQIFISPTTLLTKIYCDSVCLEPGKQYNSVSGSKYLKDNKLAKIFMKEKNF